jgi:hypothetical protein
MGAFTLLGLMSAFPTNWLGFLAGMGLAFALSVKRRLSVFDWLLVAFINVPALICLYAQIVHEAPLRDITVLCMFLITLCGIGGFGLGWCMMLIAFSATRAVRGLS